MPTFSLQHFGPIDEATLSLGNLTLFVGEQATGKSLWLQLFKLFVDHDNITDTLSAYSYAVEESPENLLNCYLGRGLSSLWKTETIAQGSLDESHLQPLTKEDLGKKPTTHPWERIFYIPAQRVLALDDGHLRMFSDFTSSTPYVLRKFSETLRQFFEKGFCFSDMRRDTLMLNDPVRRHVFHDGYIASEVRDSQRKLTLHVDGENIPFVGWSAGQKEFTPLLMALYYSQMQTYLKRLYTPKEFVTLCGYDFQHPENISAFFETDSKIKDKKFLDYIIIEEPESNLHPAGILAFLLQVIELLSRGHHVLISTHYPLLLEFAWAFKKIQRLPLKDAQEAFVSLFDLQDETEKTRYTNCMRYLQSLSINTFFFERKDTGKVVARDISSLDIDSDDPSLAEWGGLSSFATKASSIISQYWRYHL